MIRFFQRCKDRYVILLFIAKTFVLAVSLNITVYGIHLFGQKMIDCDQSTKLATHLPMFDARKVVNSY